MKRLTFLILFIFSPLLMADGFYLGAGGGLGVGLFKADYTSPINDNDDTAVVPAYINMGYKHSFGSVSVSVEVEYLRFLGAKLEETKKVRDPNDSSKTIELEYDRGTLEGAYAGHLLVGYHYSPMVELFGRVGYGKTGYEIGAKNTTDVTPFSSNDKLTTTHIGFGAKFRANDELTLNLEYRYMKLDEYQYPVYGKTEPNVQFIAASFNYFF